MKKTSIKAAEMVRRIRDAHCDQLCGKSPGERMAFYRAKAGLLQDQVSTPRQKRRGLPRRGETQMSADAHRSRR